MTVGQYLLNVAIGLDQFANTLIGGYPDETISSRCYRERDTHWYARLAMRVLDVLFSPWGPDHCKASYESELNHSHIFPHCKVRNKGHT